MENNTVKSEIEYIQYDDDDNSIIFLGSNSDEDLEEIEIVSLVSENSVEESMIYLKEERSEFDEDPVLSLGEEEENVLRESTEESSTAKFVDKSVQTDDVIILPIGTNIDLLRVQTTENGNENASISNVENSTRDDGRASTSADYSASATKKCADETQSNSSVIQKSSNWRDIRPYHKGFHRKRSYNYGRKNNYQNNSSNINRWDSRNNRDYYDNINPNWPVEVQNYYKERIYGGFAKFVNYVFHDDQKNYYNN